MFLTVSGTKLKPVKPYPSKQQPSPEKKSGKKTLVKILVPVGVVVLAAIAVVILWLTGVFTFELGSKNSATDGNPDISSVGETGNSQTVAVSQNPAPQPVSQPPVTPPVQPPPIAVEGITGSGGFTVADGSTEYAFMPDESGLWEFCTSDNGESVPFLTVFDSRGNIVGQDDDSIDGSNALILIHLEAGSAYTVEAGFYGDETGKYTLTVTLLETISIPGFGWETRVDGVTYCTFRPDHTAIWVFTTYDNGDSDPYLTIYDSSGNMLAYDNDGVGDNNSFIAIYLDEGASYTVKAGFYMGGTGSYTLNVSHVIALPESEGSIRIEEGRVYSFIPDRTGIWEFKTSDNGDSDPYLNVYDPYGNIIAYDDDSAGDKNAVVTFFADAGSPHMIDVLFDGEGACTLTMTLITEVAYVQSGDALPGDGGDFRLTALSELIFVPEQSATWEFKTSDSNYAFPYIVVLSEDGDIIGVDNDSAGEYDALLALDLDSGSTYYILVGFQSDFAGACTLSMVIR